MISTITNGLRPGFLGARLRRVLWLWMTKACCFIASVFGCCDGDRIGARRHENRGTARINDEHVSRIALTEELHGVIVVTGASVNAERILSTDFDLPIVPVLEVPRLAGHQCDGFVNSSRRSLLGVNDSRRGSIAGGQAEQQERKQDFHGGTIAPTFAVGL
jgi:hypothetical protein